MDSRIRLPIDEDLEIGDLLWHDKSEILEVVSEPNIFFYKDGETDFLGKNFHKGYDLRYYEDNQHGVKKGTPINDRDVHTGNWEIHPITLKKKRREENLNKIL